MKIFILIFIIVFYCGNLYAQTDVQIFPTDKQSTHETIQLYRSLFKLQQKGVMFGQNLIHNRPGVLHVGATVEILD